MTGTATASNHDNPPKPGLMDITAVAARLGVSVRRVRRLVHERRIPYIKWGHLIRFDPADIEPWIDSARREAASDDPIQPHPSLGALRPAQPSRRVRRS